MSLASLLGLLHYIVALGVSVRVMLKPRMAASVRLAWILVIEIVPVGGILAWALFGEVRMRRADRQRAADMRDAITQHWEDAPFKAENLPQQVAAVSAQARATGGFLPHQGNRLRLLPEGDEAMTEMASAINAAGYSVVILFYIWLDDASGRKIARACAAAARRGVAVKIIVDALGSRKFLRSATWRRMIEAGVEGVEAFPLTNPLTALLGSRLDLRNHRKIVVIDGKLGFTGSRNCSDMAFAAKPKFGPWIDVLMSVEGPVVRQLEAVFIQDWLIASQFRGASHSPLSWHRQPSPQPLPPPPDEVCLAGSLPKAEGHEITLHPDKLAALLPHAKAVTLPGEVVQVVPTGPDFRPGNLSDLLATMIHSARESITITTPYYVPDEALDSAIQATARRGVKVTIVLPERNDSSLVQAVSDGFHEDLLRAGVSVQLFTEGLIHSKIVTVDGIMTLVGSANLDRRSFDLNYEISLLIADQGFTRQIDERQQTYLDRSRVLTLAEVKGRSTFRTLAGNVASLAAPLL